MGKNWQVCELEDMAELLSERFSVASVPESWIFAQEDGSLICYWPKYNAAQKIRSLRAPKEGDKCTYYKCRLLMNGAKFSLFEEAKHAEKIAQNSSIMNSSDLTETNQLCQSTIDFIVTDVDNEDISGTYRHGTITFDVSDYNNENAGQYVKNPTAFIVEDLQLDDPYKNLPNVVNDSKLLDIPSYNALFTSCNQFLTSTVHDEHETFEKVDDLDDFLLSKVSTIESKMSLFVQTTHEALNDIKASVSKRRKIDHVKEDSSSNFDHESVSSLNETFPETNNKNNASKGEGFKLLNEHDTKRTNIQRTEVLNVEILKLPFIEKEQDVPLTDATFEKRSMKVVKKPIILNETFAAKFSDCNTSECLKVPNMEADTAQDGQSIEMISEADLESSNDPEQTPGEKYTKRQVLLPNDDIDQFKRNEDLLEDEETFKEALTEHLSPYEEEDEIQYMNRTIFTVFTEKFFLNHVAWRADEKHVNITHTNALSCWKGSYAKKFKPDDVNSTIFKHHIRRVKSAKRAAIKSAKNKLMQCAKRSMK